MNKKYISYIYNSKLFITEIYLNIQRNLLIFINKILILFYYLYNIINFILNLNRYYILNLLVGDIKINYKLIINDNFKNIRNTKYNFILCYN